MVHFMLWTVLFVVGRQCPVEMQSARQPTGVHHRVFECGAVCNRGGSLLAPTLDCLAALAPPPRLAAFGSRRRDALVVTLTLHTNPQLDSGSKRDQATLHVRYFGRIKVADDDTREAFHMAGSEEIAQMVLGRAATAL